MRRCRRALELQRLSRFEQREGRCSPALSKCGVLGSVLTAVGTSGKANEHTTCQQNAAPERDSLCSVLAKLHDTSYNRPATGVENLGEA